MWFVFVDQNSLVKPHWVPKEYKELLISDLVLRHGAYPSKENCREKTQITFEGSLFIFAPDQPWMVFELPGEKQIRIDCHSVNSTFSSLQERSRRQFAEGTPYYKLCRRDGCLILSPADRESLLFQLRGKLEEAERLADDFHCGGR